METEHVLVVPTRLFHELGHFRGFTADVAHYMPALIDPANVSYKPRPDMEKDPSFKQLIPYVIVRYKTDNDVFLFAYTRGKSQGEARLHAKRSIGIGGHISSADATGGSSYENGMYRELAEEVTIAIPHTIAMVGLINEDDTEVGKVHLGVVHIVDVPEPLVFPREDGLCDAKFVPLRELLADKDRFELWSQFCLEQMDPANQDTDVYDERCEACPPQGCNGDRPCEGT